MQICDLLKIVEPLAALYKGVAQRERLVSLHVLPRVKPALQGGLYMPRLCDIQYGELYIDKNLGSVPLGVTEDDIDAAIGDSMKLCADILDGKAKTIGMKGE